MVFYGVTEAPNGEQESCESIVCNIIRTNLEIEEEIQLERAHRLGRKHDQRPRPIVAKFIRYPQRELVRKTASKLKGTSISLGEQFPKEIQERRKQLLPILRREKERGRRVVHRRETIPSRHRRVYRHAIGIRSNARWIQG